MNGASASGGLSFARGFIGFGWVVITLLGPVAIFVTSYGDCFAESCTGRSEVDIALYGLDVVAWFALSMLGLLIVWRPRQARFLAVGVLGLFVVGQSLAGFLGAPAFYDFWILLPAGLALIAGGVIGAWVLAGSAPSWLRGSAGLAAGIGCAAYVLPALTLFGVGSILAGSERGVLFFGVTVAVIAIAVVWWRRSAGRSRRRDLVAAGWLAAGEGPDTPSVDDLDAPPTGDTIV